MCARRDRAKRERPCVNLGLAASARWPSSSHRSDPLQRKKSRLLLFHHSRSGAATLTWSLQDLTMTVQDKRGREDPHSTPDPSGDPRPNDSDLPSAGFPPAELPRRVPSPDRPLPSLPASPRFRSASPVPRLPVPES